MNGPQKSKNMVYKVYIEAVVPREVEGLKSSEIPALILQDVWDPEEILNLQAPARES